MMPWTNQSLHEATVATTADDDARSDRVLTLIGLLLACASLLFTARMIVDPPVPDILPPSASGRIETGTTPAKSTARSADYELVVASRDRALVLFDGRIFYLKPGSQLPDDSVVEEFVLENGAWSMTTSSGRQILPSRASTAWIGS